jgi:hypothetical protein
MLSDDLLEDARHLAAKGIAETRPSCMRRAISTAYYAVFHLLIEDFVEHWEFEDQRAASPECSITGKCEVRPSRP